MGCRSVSQGERCAVGTLRRCCRAASQASKNVDKSGASAPDYFDYTENELPQPQLPVAFGLLNVNPDPITEFT
jgi:hypothetical protein